MKINRQSVSIIGVGITSIMVALRLYEDYNVTVYTKGPDPRLDRNAEQFGSTGNGESARFITGFEGGPREFENLPLQQGGWLPCSLSDLSNNDQEWLQKRESAFKEPGHIVNLEQKYYVPNASVSLAEWLVLRRQMPFLFEGADASDPQEGVLVLCDNQELLEATVIKHEKAGFLKQVLSTGDISIKFPLYRKAVTDGIIAGGILIEGFSLNIHQFTENAIFFLEKKGVSFLWGVEISNMEFDPEGRLLGLKVKNGEMIVSKHFSVNPGAYGSDFLRGTMIENKIAGVAGRWLVMPRPNAFTIPTKIMSRNRLTVSDNNLTPFTSKEGVKMLAVSGGFLYLGTSMYDVTDSAYQAIDEANLKIVHTYLGESGAVLYQNNRSKKICLRSFTYDDQPLYEIVETARGGSLVVTAGTNTGTTALAPYLAQSIEQVFRSKDAK